MAELSLQDRDDIFDEVEHRISTDMRLDALEETNVRQEAELKSILQQMAIDEALATERASSARTSLVLEVLIALLVGLETIATFYLAFGHGSGVH